MSTEKQEPPSGELKEYQQRVVEPKDPATSGTQEALTKLLELSRTLATTHDIGTALTQAITAAADIVPAAERGTLQWWEEDEETLQTVAFSDGKDAQSDIPSFRAGEGVAGHALAQKQVINVPDVLADKRFVPGQRDLHFLSILVAPLIVKDRPLGTLSLTSASPHAFSPRDETLVSLIADQVAVALENTYEFNARQQAEKSLQRYTERLKTLNEIGQSILAARHPDTIAVAAIRRIRWLIPCERAMVMAIEETNQVQLLASETSGTLKSIDDIGIYREIVQNANLAKGWVHGVEDLNSLAQRSALQQSLYEAGVRSFVVVPSFIQDELVGTLHLESERPRAFAPDHITIATEVAASLAVATRQARLFEKAQQEIAERKQAEAILRRYTSELEMRNAELNAFAHTVAHDLKNPLGVLMGYADMLARSRERLPEKMLEDALQTIARHTRKMAEIVNDLLLLSSVRSKEVDVVPLEMGRIITEARGRVLHLIEEYQGEILVPDNWPIALGYAPWVEAIWANYISNALKYGGRPPRVELGADVEKDGMIRFWIRDNGLGLTDEEQARLFTPFERLHQRRAKGHGLGLSIVQRIAKKLNGQAGVECDGTPGQGCTFYFTLPGLPLEQR